MRKPCLALGLLIALPGLAPVQAETVVLKPTSQWNVDYGDERCRLARLFSDGDKEHFLYFEQHFPSSSTGVTAGGYSFGRFENLADTAVQTADGRAALQTKPYKGAMARYRDALIYSNLNLARDAQSGYLPGLAPAVPHLDTAFADTIAYLSFRQRSREVRFETGPLGDAFTVLNQCSESLIEFWGLDAALHKSARRLPTWVNQEEVAQKIMKHYPAGAGAVGEGGIMRMRVIVDQQGSPESCVISKSTVADSLKSPACQMVMKEARFEPGLDGEGKPMRSYYPVTLTYQISD